MLGEPIHIGNTLKTLIEDPKPDPVFEKGFDSYQLDRIRKVGVYIFYLLTTSTIYIIEY